MAMISQVNLKPILDLSRMNYGSVRLWKHVEGWGFIESDDGEDYFFNISCVRKGQKIREHINVKFDTEETLKGTQAVNVSRT